MDSLRNKAYSSELLSSKMSIGSLASPQISTFDKLLQFVREKYNQRLRALESAGENYKNLCSQDPAIKVMRESAITEKYADSRMNELFHSSLITENEQTITLLQNELMQKKSENLKLEQQLYFMKVELEKTEDKLKLGSDRNYYISPSSRENSKDLYEKEKHKTEALENEIESMKNEITKARELYFEYEKLQRYVEQLEDERDKFHESVGPQSEVKTIMEAQKQAGVETIKELQTAFKKKSKIFKKKILEQKQHIESLENDLKTTKKTRNPEPQPLENSSQQIQELKNYYEKREAEAIEKHKSQIISLQNQFQELMEKKIQQIQSQIDPRLMNNSISQEQYSEICRQKKEVENELLQMKISVLQYKETKNEGYEKEITDAKIKILKADEKISQQNMLINEYEEAIRKYKEGILSKEKDIQTLKSLLQNDKSKIHKSQLLKLKNITFLMSSQQTNIKAAVDKYIKEMATEYMAKIKDFGAKLITKSKSLHNSKMSSMITENRNLSNLLRTNSEAFDRLQQEVQSEAMKIKMKSQKGIEKVVKECREKYEKEIEDLRAQIVRQREELEKVENSVQFANHLNKQLKDEVDWLRNEKDNMRKKQIAIEERLTTQTSDFRVQMKNKQNEIDMLRKTIN
ncbi:hypothetical protein SteCoe_17690 [Stentor coeruleus]|uniref:Uncharacterized protein n=1 Tax=Stentor coeruleus TaxID=5963 RepID=A0A1R2BY70_9CILI|nr:hypothetical protein SteCoe_17690 [Stentor coeruleus]